MFVKSQNIITRQYFFSDKILKKSWKLITAYKKIQTDEENGVYKLLEFPIFWIIVRANCIINRITNNRITRNFVFVFFVCLYSWNINYEQNKNMKILVTLFLIKLYVWIA